MGHPDVISTKDKRYRLGMHNRSEVTRLNGLPVQLPIELSTTVKSSDIFINVADDVKSAYDAGKLWKCELQIMLPNTTESDEIDIFLNGEKMPRSIQRYADWVYQLRPRPEYAVNGYRIHVDLMDKYLPKVGHNIINVLINKKDEQIVDPIHIAEVRIALDYLPHRNALRDEETFEG